MDKVKRLLIIKLSSIGDVVHALPVSAAIGRNFPHIEITWVVEEMSAPVLAGNPYIKEVLTIPTQWKRSRWSFGTVRELASLTRRLRARRFNVSIDLQGLSKSALLAYLSGAPIRLGYCWLREIAPLLEKPVPRHPESAHIVDQLLDVAEYLGAERAPVEFPLAVSPGNLSRAKVLLSQVAIDYRSPFIVVNPSDGGGGYKGLGADRIAVLIRRLHEESAVPVVLVGSAADQKVADQIIEQARFEVPSLVSMTTLAELIAILKLCSLHLSGDTGTAHIAAALGRPVISIFGRSNPDRLAPYGQLENVIVHRECCHSICKRFHETAPINSKQKCMAPPPSCLAAVTAEEVLAAVYRLLPGKLNVYDTI